MDSFDFSLRHSLHTYVESELKAGHAAESQIGGKPLFFVVIEQLCLRMVKILVSHGADPNFQQLRNMTTGQRVLELLNAREHTELPQGSAPLVVPDKVNDWAEVIQIFLENDADPSADIDGITLDSWSKDHWENGIGDGLTLSWVYGLPQENLPCSCCKGQPLNWTTGTANNQPARPP